MFNGQQIPEALAEAIPDNSRDVIRRSCRACNTDIWSVYDKEYAHGLYRSDGTEDDSTFLTGGGANIQILVHRFNAEDRFICGDCHMDVLDTAHERWMTRGPEPAVRWRQSGEYIIPDNDSFIDTSTISQVDQILNGERDMYDDYIIIDTPSEAYQQAGTPLYPNVNSFVTPEKIILHEPDALRFKSVYDVKLPSEWTMPNTLASF